MSGTIQASVVKDSASSTSNLTLDASGNVTVGNNLTVTGSTTVAATTIGNLTYTGTLTGSTGILNIGSGQIYKDASGNVGIGTSSPSTYGKFSVYGTGQVLMATADGTVQNNVSYLASGVAYTGTVSAHPLAFTTSNTERMRIDSSGNVSVGVASATEKLTVGDGFVSSRMSSGNMARFNLVNTNRSWSISNYGTQYSPNGAFVIADETAGTPRLTIDSSGIVTGSAGNLMLVQGTSQASTSGTSITFTSIPSWVKRITVMFNGVSTNGTSNKQIQLGAGSVTNTGYTSSSTVVGTTAGTYTSTTGLVFGSTLTSDSICGIMTIANVSANIWVCSHSAYTNSTPQSTFGGGIVGLSGTLDRVVITTVNGTDTFDAGSINILYE